MGLQDDILSNMEQITEDDKEVIGAFLKKTYTQEPSKQINLEVRTVKSIKCVNEGCWCTIAVSSTKIESIADWLKNEGFTLVPNYRPNFCGYKVFLTDKYAPL